MSEQTKFWIQTLIIPAVLAFIGYLINDTLQAQQRAFDKIKFTDQVINEAFDSNNPDKALALTRIIPSLTDDKQFSDSLIALVNNYYTKKATLALKTANEDEYRQIATAATVFDGNGITISDSLKAKPETKNAEEARHFEQKGLEDLQNGNLESAQQNFKAATTAYPGFKSSHSIYNFLTFKMQQIKQGGNAKEAQQEVRDSVQKSYGQN